MSQFIPILLFILALGGIIYVIYYLFTCIKLPLRTMNCYTGDLGAGKTFLGTKNAIKERNTSVVRYWIHNKYYWLFAIIDGIIMTTICLKLMSLHIILFVIIGIIYCLWAYWKYHKCRKDRKDYFIRDLYANYPIYLYTKHEIRKRKETEQEFKERIMMKYYGIEEAVITEASPLLIIKLLHKLKIIKKIKTRKYNIRIYCKALKKGHILGTIRTSPAPIIVCDEASQLFPNNNKKSDIIVEEAIRWFRQHTYARHIGSGSLYIMDQSIGSLDISVRRRIGTVYLLANWRRKFLFFYSVDVDKIKYAEDLVVNVNDITEWRTKHIIGIIGKRRYDSCYHRLFYKPKMDYERIWKDSLIDPDDTNVNDITVGYGSVYNNQKTLKQ